MTNSDTFLLSTAFQALTISSVLAVLLMNTSSADVRGRQDCPPFSCGHLQDIRYPFRLRGDPPDCGAQAYELVCNDSKAIIRINTGRYFVTDISYSSSVFWVVNASLGNSSCPVPAWNQHPYIHGLRSANRLDLSPDAVSWATFVNCSRVVEKNGMYRPVACLSAKNSFVYVLTSWRSYHVQNLETSCRFLAMVPLGNWQVRAPENASYPDVIKFMRNGFAVRFPVEFGGARPYSWVINNCMNDSISHFREQMSSTNILDRTSAIVRIGVYFLTRVNYYSYRSKLFWAAVTVVSAIYVVTSIIALAILLRFMFAPLAVWTFLAYKFLKTRKSMDTVEKFLRMQQALGPTRYAYSDLIAITGHFRDKVGQGGYGSVYKGVLPGDVYVAIKMLGNSVCNGEEFISEVSTIGRIHHVNVVRLVGFCSEEMRRALVYEYMPHGSLDKYIFSSDRSLSWDKLNEIALGIARGIDYLHQGCDVQILHFDIKPHNILLDDSFVPKIADFGLAKLYPRDHSLLSVSAIRGTIGYIAPEMISRSFGIISNKSDVYSFGMLLLEMAGRRRNFYQDAGTPSQVYYPAWVYERLSRQEVGEISKTVGMHDMEKKLCIVGLWCIQMMSHERPTMSEVVEMLEVGVNGLQIPPEPFFCGDENIRVMNSCHLTSELSAISEEDA